MKILTFSILTVIFTLNIVYGQGEPRITNIIYHTTYPGLVDGVIAGTDDYIEIIGNGFGAARNDAYIEFEGCPELSGLKFINGARANDDFDYIISSIHPTNIQWSNDRILVKPPTTSLWASNSAEDEYRKLKYKNVAGTGKIRMLRNNSDRSDWFGDEVNIPGALMQGIGTNPAGVIQKGRLAFQARTNHTAADGRLYLYLCDFKTEPLKTATNLLDELDCRLSIDIDYTSVVGRSRLVVTATKPADVAEGEQVAVGNSAFSIFVDGGVAYYGLNRIGIDQNNNIDKHNFIHEFAHLFGLAHVNNPGALMYWKTNSSLFDNQPDDIIDPIELIEYSMQYGSSVPVSTATQILTSTPHIAGANLFSFNITNMTGSTDDKKIKIDFTDQSTTGAFTPHWWHWNFADGNFSYDQNPINKFKEVDNYPVELMTCDGTNTYTEILNLDLNCLTNIPTPKEMKIDAKKINDSRYQFSVVAEGYNKNLWTYSWEFGDGQTSLIESPEHEYVACGKYNIVFKINACDKIFEYTANVNIKKSCEN